MASKCAKCSKGAPHSYEHGTLNGYTYHRCRCAECKWAAAAYRKENAGRIRQTTAKWRAENPDRVAEYNRNYALRNPEKIASKARRQYHRNRQRVKEGYSDFSHGLHGYIRYGCRCEACLAAYSEYCTSESVREYHRNYVNENRSKVNTTARIAARRRRSRDPLFDAEAQQRYRDGNREKLAARWRSYYEANRDRERVRSKRKRARRASMKIPKTRHGMPWSASEDVVVMDLSLTITESAYILGRSYESVSKRRAVIRNRRKEKSA